MALTAIMGFTMAFSILLFGVTSRYLVKKVVGSVLAPMTIAFLITGINSTLFIKKPYVKHYDQKIKKLTIKNDKYVIKTQSFDIKRNYGEKHIPKSSVNLVVKNKLKQPVLRRYYHQVPQNFNLYTDIMTLDEEKPKIKIFIPKNTNVL